MNNSQKQKFYYVIIGGGITGITSAYFLSKKGNYSPLRKKIKFHRLQNLKKINRI